MKEIFLKIDRDHFQVQTIIVSDQSDLDIAKTNRGLLYTVKDVLTNMLGTADHPRIFHFHFDGQISQIAYECLRDPLRIRKEEKGSPILGKGINMAISSLVSSDLSTAGRRDRDTVLVYMDAENKEVNYRDPFLLGSPLIYEGSPILFSKAAFKRYHMEGERRKLGGRVNASLGVPLISMLIYKGLIPLKKTIVYPLSGEIGIERNLFWSMRIAKRFGVETTTLLQLFGRDEKGNTMLPEERFLQVDLGINMDQPIAEGKPGREVLRGVRRMSEDIIHSTFQIMGKQIRETWGSYEEFMKMFKEFQRHSMERWIQSHDNRLITGGISHEQLRRVVYSVVRENADNLYAEEKLLKKNFRKIREALSPGDEGFMPPINKIKDAMGNNFEELRERLIQKAERIY
ncbi:MAG: hypothetical protein JSW70_04115 [Syntrophobacterales bacterium]|nr:MAG: hypothetical protein JSW70_04115 [Syntrophobacterales bacterium]